MVLNLWDCGGQEAFMESYFVSQRDHIFRNVQVLIYVFDVESRDLERDYIYYLSCLEALQQHSKDAKIFCLIHKMDLIVPEDRRSWVFQERQADLVKRSAELGFVPTCFQSSIWDETLYRAWSSIVYSLIPNVASLEKHVQDFRDICEADEIVLFEKATFLVISSVSSSYGTSYGTSSGNTSNGNTSNGTGLDPHRFEKISNIIKQFKLSCSKFQSQFQSMELMTSMGFSCFMDSLTSNTFVMVVMSDKSNIQPAATLLNIRSARKLFEQLEFK